MAFKYQMQKVLYLMENREKAIDAEVLAASHARNIEQDKLNEIELRKTAAQKGLNAQMASGATSDVASSNDYIQLLNLRVEAQMKVLKAAEQVVEAAKEKQMVARRERQKIEKHKEMKFKEWLIEDKKKEAKRIDEMAGNIFMKKRAMNAEMAIEDMERMEKMQKLELLKLMREKRESQNKW